MHAHNHKAPRIPAADPRREQLLASSSSSHKPQHQQQQQRQQCHVELSTPPLLPAVPENASCDNATTRLFLPLSSFPAENDDYPTVTLYDEIKEMLLSAILTYGVVHLRKLASNKQKLQQEQQQNEQSEASFANDDNSNNSNHHHDRSQMVSSMLAEQLLSLPISAREVVRLVSRYRDDIVAEVGKEATVDLYLTAFDDIQSTQSSRELELELNKTTLEVSLVSFDIQVVEDEHENNDLVYAICVDTGRRRITVSFRGCSSRKDWLVCCQTYLKELDNPLYDGDNDTFKSSQQSLTESYASSVSAGRQRPPKISIHSGYYNYLFLPREEEGGETKFDAIMGHLNRLLRQYPGYSVYVTGHSLGAALATVFSFHAAASGLLKPADPTYETPTVTCINFASPMVGNIDFETAFRDLEDQGKIRCLRVTNYYDIFTQLPDRGNWLYLLVFMPWIGVHLLLYFGFSLLFFMYFQGNVYRHVGMNLQLYKGHKCWTSWLAFRRRRLKKRGDMTHEEIMREDNQFRFWYKIKHSHGTADNFMLRVVQDFKKHMKQLIQRLLALPLLTNFDANHRAHEHLLRVKGLKYELKQLHIKDLYGLRTPPSSPHAARSPVQIPTNFC